MSTQRCNQFLFLESISGLKSKFFACRTTHAIELEMSERFSRKIRRMTRRGDVERVGTEEEPEALKEISEAKKT